MNIGSSCRSGLRSKFNEVKYGCSMGYDIEVSQSNALNPSFVSYNTAIIVIKVLYSFKAFY